MIHRHQILKYLLLEHLDLRNQNEQEVAAGLYFYTIEDLTSQNNEPHIGKFVVIR